MKKRVVSSLSALCVGMLLALLIVFEKDASTAAKEALSLVVGSVLPALFPYMVVSSVIISLDLLEPIYSLVPTEKLFSLPRASAQVILCGMLCGFPIGAVGAANLYESGKASKSDAARICALSSQTSPAFLVGAVGNWWGSKNFGIYLFAAQIVFALVVGIILGRFTKESPSPITSQVTPKASFTETLCSAMSTASLSCLAITGYIVFFRVISVLFSSVCPILTGLFMTTFEFSTGAHFGSVVGGLTGAAITGFAVGFSGLSVFMQCVNFTEKCGISMKPYVLMKLCEGAFLAASSLIFAYFFPLEPSVSAFSPADKISPVTVAVALCLIVIAFFVSSLCRKRNYFTYRY